MAYNVVHFVKFIRGCSAVDSVTKHDFLYPCECKSGLSGFKDTIPDIWEKTRAQFIDDFHFGLDVVKSYSKL